jgi:pyruvate/2-oxoglutarate dehydrogenase complex dihydrolipoamide dehydrogenase (E3) component
VAARSDLIGSPRVVFTEPQLAAVGLTLAAARDRGIDARAVDVQTAANAGASFIGRNAPGTSRLVVDEARGIVVGASFVGPEIAESLHAATIAVAAEVPLERLWHAVPTFPTRSELWLRLLERYGL